MKEAFESGIQRWYQGISSSYNRYPDEKGTERKNVPASLIAFHQSSAVTTVTPMKRGLKAMQ